MACINNIQYSLNITLKYAKRETMYSRISNSAQYLASFVPERVQNLAVGVLAYAYNAIDVKCGIPQLVAKSEKASSGIAIQQLGLGFFSYRRAVVNPKQLAPDEKKKFVETYMQLQRWPQDLSTLTNSIFTPGLSTEKAVHLRKRLVRYFTMENINQTANASIKILFNLIENNNNADEHKREYLSMLVNHNVRRMISTTLLGCDVPRDLFLLLDELRGCFDLVSVIPAKLQKWHPRLRRLHHELDVKIKELITNKFKALRMAPDPDMMSLTDADKNVLCDFAKEKLKNKPWSELEDDEIETLANNPELRTYVITLIAVDGFEDLINISISALLKDGLVSSDFKFKLLDEIQQKTSQNEEKKATQSVYEISSSTLLNTDEMPLLHAMYLEALSASPPTPMILRYTDKALRVGNDIIPAKTTVILNLDAMVKEYQKVGADDRLPSAERWYPERFIKGYAPDFDLDANIELNTFGKKLNEEGFLPFGATERACPARHIVELIYKKYIATFMMLVSKIDDKEFVTFKTFEKKERLCASPTMGRSSRSP